MSPGRRLRTFEAQYGKDHPFTRSALYGEFMSYGEGVNQIIELPEIEVWRSSSIGSMPGPTVLACDFACGGGGHQNLSGGGVQGSRIVHFVGTHNAAAALW